MCNVTEKKILVLGGSRFIGRAVVKKLIDQHCFISCFNRGNHLLDWTGVRELRGDRLDAESMKHLFREHYDIVMDFSGTEWSMIENTVQYARDACDRYIFISSSSVYDPKMLNPHREEECLNSGVGNAYARAKILGEALIAKTFEHATIIRPSKVYGPGNYYFSERNFLNRISKEAPVRLKNDPILHFTYVEDLADGILSLMHTDGFFNVAGLEPAKLSSFLHLIAEQRGLTPHFVMDEKGDFPFSDLQDRILDLSAVKKATGWEPVTGLREGLQKIFQDRF